MNFKTFAKFVMALGIIVIVYSLIYYADNLPRKFAPSKSSRGPFGGRNDIGNYLNVMSENDEREVRRKTATKIMIGGVIVLFIGIGLFASARNGRNIQNEEGKCTKFCPECGAELSPDDKFCPNCGAKIE